MILVQQSTSNNIGPCQGCDEYGTPDNVDRNHIVTRITSERFGRTHAQRLCGYCLHELRDALPGGFFHEYTRAEVMAGENQNQS